MTPAHLDQARSIRSAGNELLPAQGYSQVDLKLLGRCHVPVKRAIHHKCAAVYGEMLPRQPLRFLLAGDPGAGKTIMAGLLIKELLIRSDLRRCMIVCPGNLGEQWQHELYQRFQLPFEILTNDKLESARTGNWFAENQLVICRLDKLSRNEDVQAKLEATEWDLIVCDEAHKMS